MSAVEVRQPRKPLPRIGGAPAEINVRGLAKIAKEWARKNPNPLWRPSRKQRGIK